MSESAVIESGCLMLADVSGYTSYLMGSELEHAHDVLDDLMGILVGHLGEVFTVNELEGDAVFAYGLTDSLTPAMALDTVDETYFAFMARRRDIGAATSCQCNACIRIPSLDLKFVAHYGSFVRKRDGERETLTGGDVIVAHRLLKNSVSQELGIRGYALLTRSAIDAFGLDPTALGLAFHSETYDDVGTIEGFVADLEARWRYEEERRRVYVSRGDTRYEFVAKLRAPPPLVWEYLTSPAKRPMWQSGIDRVDQNAKGGRAGVGTVNHCVHGRGAVVEEILDWRPYDYFTLRSELPKLGTMVNTTELRAEGGETEVSMRIAKPKGRLALLAPVAFSRMRANLEQNIERLVPLLEEEMAGTSG